MWLARFLAECYPGDPVDSMATVVPASFQPLDQGIQSFGKSAEAAHRGLAWLYGLRQHSDVMPPVPGSTSLGWRHLLRERNFSSGCRLWCNCVRQSADGSQDRQSSGALKSPLESTVPLVLR